MSLLSRLVRIGLTASWLVLLGACTAGDEPEVDGDASCAAVLEVDGVRFVGTGELRRTPETTGRTVPAVQPGCDDSGGQDDAGSADEPVEADVLADVAPDVAVLLSGTLYVRDGEPVPTAVRTLLTPPLCTSAGTVELSGDWLGVMTSREPRFDGDLRVPYRLEVRVVEGPAVYVGTTLDLRVNDDAAATLTPDDVRTSLWQGGRLTAEVRCDEQQRFEVVAARTP